MNGSMRADSPGPQHGGVVESLEEAQCVKLISSGGVGRLAFTGRYGLTVLPVNYTWFENSIVLRTKQGSPLDEDLRTGIPHAEYQVAFEVDEIDAAAREGWSVLVQGAAHHVDSDSELQQMRDVEVDVWPGGPKEMFLRIVPNRMTGRVIHHEGRTDSG